MSGQGVLSAYCCDGGGGMNRDTRLLGHPVNKQAALSCAKGERFRFEAKDPRNPHWKQNPGLSIRVNKGEVNLAGTRLGKLTVMGKSLDKSGRWIVRCACGNYENRTSRAIKNLRNDIDACVECRTINQRKRHHAACVFFDKYGFWPHESSSTEAQRLMEMTQ